MVRLDLKLLKSSIKSRPDIIDMNSRSSDPSLLDPSRYHLGLTLMSQMGQALNQLRDQRYLWQRRMSDRQSNQGLSITAPISSLSHIAAQLAASTDMEIGALVYDEQGEESADERSPLFGDWLGAEVKEPATWGYQMILRSDPQITGLKAQADLYFAQAINVWSELIRQDSADAQAYVYRAKTRELWAEGIALTLLPAGERPPYYPLLSTWKQQIESASRDVSKALSLLAQHFGAEKPSQEMQITTAMTYADAAHLYQLQQKWDNQIECLSNAIDLKPSMILHLSRAKAYIRKGFFNCSAQDCVLSLERLSSHIPNSKRAEFESAVSLIKIELDRRNYIDVIKFTLRFWRENAVMLVVE